MKKEPLEPVLLLLCAMVLIFTALLLITAKWMPSDGQTFQVMSGLLTGFAGALLGRVKPPSSGKPSTNENTSIGGQQINVSEATTEGQ